MIHFSKFVKSLLLKINDFFLRYQHSFRRKGICIYNLRSLKKLLW